MLRTRTLVVPALLLLAACNRPPQVATPRYAADIFSEDTLQAHVTVKVDSGMEVFLNGAGFYTIKKVQPVVLTPASLTIRGTGTATISSVDSMQLLALVPAGTHPDSTEAVTTVGRILRVTRAAGQPNYKLEIARP